MAKTYEEWYKENKARLSKKRKERYKKDIEFRETRKKQARDYYEEKKQSTEPRDKTVITTDLGMELITIGKLAVVIKREIQTIRAYHRDKVIPSPDHFDTRGWRLYTIAQALLLKDTFERFDAGELHSLAEVTEVIHNEWHKEEVRNGKAA